MEKYKMADPIKAKEERGSNVEMQPYISFMICIAPWTFFIYNE